MLLGSDIGRRDRECSHAFKSSWYLRTVRCSVVFGMKATCTPDLIGKPYLCPVHVPWSHQQCAAVGVPCKQPSITLTTLVLLELTYS
eukprot:scaffold182740_cov22-Tisochrysis_lutea.AAC.4